MLLQVALSLLALSVARVVWRRWHYDLHRIPSPPAFPLLGNTLDLFLGNASEHVWMYFRNAFHRHGNPRMIKVVTLGVTRLFIRDTAFIKDIMNDKDKSFPREIDPSMPILPMIGNDATAKALILTATPTPYVKAFRKMFGTAFSNANLAASMPKINRTMDKFLEYVEATRTTGPINFQDLCTRMTLDAIGTLVFDLNLGGLDDSRPLLQLMEYTSEIGTAYFYNPLLKKYCELFPWTKKGKMHKLAIDSINAEWNWIIDEIKKRDDPEDGSQPLWWLLKNLVDPETGMPLDPKSVKTEVAFTVVVGMDTTAHQLAWILSLLASHPKVQNKFLKELKDYGLDKEEREVTFQDLSDLVYLTAIVKEGMRLAYIATGSFMRVVPEDMKILGYRIPKGTLIAAAGNRGLGSIKEWGDPDVFRPERWIEEDVSNNYYMDFWTGPRDCVGQRLAMLEMRLATVRLLRSYSLELKGDIDETLKDTIDAFVIKARNGIWIHATPRRVLTRW